MKPHLIPSRIPSLIPGLFLLLMVPACSISIGGWSSSSSGWIQGKGSITSTSNGESVRANIVDKEVQIVVLRDGKLSGVDGMSAAQRKALRGLTSHGRKYVDHPRLQAWQQQLTSVNALALEQDTTAKGLADTAKGLPFEGLIDDAVTKWVGDDPKRACAMLDLVAELKPGKDTSRKLLGLALQSDAVDDDQVTSWLTAKVIYKDPQAIKTIAASKAVGTKAAEQILRNVDEVYGSERREIYIAAGRHLVGDVAQARVLVGKLDDLYGSHRMDAALALLREPGACIEYAIQLLENIDDFYGNNRLRVYLAAGQKAITDVRAPALLISQLDELYGSDRQKAAIAALDWKGSDKSMALGVLREIDEFYGNDRTHVIHHVIDGPHFQDVRVQQACFSAIRDELYGRTKRKALTRMLKTEGLDEKVRRLAIAELED